MLDLDVPNLPPHVVRLATASMVLNVSVVELMRETAEVSAQFACDAGLSFQQYLDAIDWLATYYLTHSPHGLQPN